MAQKAPETHPTVQRMKKHSRRKMATAAQAILDVDMKKQAVDHSESLATTSRLERFRNRGTAKRTVFRYDPPFKLKGE